MYILYSCRSTRDDRSRISLTHQKEYNISILKEFFNHSTYFGAVILNYLFIIKAPLHGKSSKNSHFQCLHKPNYIIPNINYTYNKYNTY